MAKSIKGLQAVVANLKAENKKLKEEILSESINADKAWRVANEELETRMKLTVKAEKIERGRNWWKKRHAKEVDLTNKQADYIIDMENKIIELAECATAAIDRGVENFNKASENFNIQIKRREDRITELTELLAKANREAEYNDNAKENVIVQAKKWHTAYYIQDRFYRSAAKENEVLRKENKRLNRSMNFITIAAVISFAISIYNLIQK